MASYFGIDIRMLIRQICDYMELSLETPRDDSEWAEIPKERLYKGTAWYWDENENPL